MPAKYITVAGDGVTRMCILPYRFEKRKGNRQKTREKCMMIEMGKRLDEKEILEEIERGEAVSAPAGARPQTPPSDYSMIQAPHRAGQNEAWVISVVVNPIRVRV